MVICLPFSGDKNHSRMKEEGVEETILLLVNDLHSTHFHTVANLNLSYIVMLCRPDAHRHVGVEHP